MRAAVIARTNLAAMTQRFRGCDIASETGRGNRVIKVDHVEIESYSRQKEDPRERGFSRVSWLEVGPCEEGRLRKCRPQVSFCLGLTGLARLCLGGMMLRRS